MADYFISYKEIWSMEREKSLCVRDKKKRTGLIKPNIRIVPVNMLPDIFQQHIEDVCQIAICPF